MSAILSSEKEYAKGSAEHAEQSIDTSRTSAAQKAGSAGFAPPSNSLVTPLLTDMYQISMTYAHWKSRKHDDAAVFDLFFRKCPFQGEFCIFAGLDECIKFISTYKFSESDVEFLKQILPAAKEPEFFEWLLQLDCSQVKVYAIPEGTAVFPKEPLLRIEGPLGITQLLETTLLNLVNFPSLVCTNACRMRIAVGMDKELMEFGLRRAQGPDGGFSASKYSYIGGFNGTSNVLAAKLTNIACKGTHAHAYVMAYTGLNELHTTTIASKADPSIQVEFLSLVLAKRAAMDFLQTNDGELAAFISYAQAYPNGLLALVDTYDTMQSGVPNFICVSLALMDLGYNSIGIRLDSGDLAYLSKAARALFHKVDAQLHLQAFGKKTIVASNDLSEDILLSLKQQGHEIDTFGIGTNLVTCQKQPALGCVYKLVEINNNPRIKLSQETEKLVIPAKKNLYRIYGSDGKPVVDVMQRDASEESHPTAGVRMQVRHPFVESKRAFVTPTKVEVLLQLVWDGWRSIDSTAKTPAEQQRIPTPSLDERRERCMSQVQSLRADHVRIIQPCPYKVSLTENLYKYTHDMWLANAPVPDL